MTKKEKFQQMKKEAKATVVVLVLIVLFWMVAGFGVDRLHITVGYTPLWVITGCIGTWLFSIGAVIWLVKKVFQDFDLDDGEEADER